MTKLMQTADYSQVDAPEAQYPLISKKTTTELTTLTNAKALGVNQFYYDTTAAALKFSTDSATLVAIGGGGAGSFTTLTASAAVTLSPTGANVVISPNGGTVSISPIGANVNILPSNGSVTINPSGTAQISLISPTLGSINNMSIGLTTAAAVKSSNYQANYTDASGSPGNATINFPRGRVAFNAASSTLVVTNSLVTASSTILYSVRSLDSTATSIVTAVASAGSFTLTANAAASGAGFVVDFMVFN